MIGPSRLATVRRRPTSPMTTAAPTMSPAADVALLEPDHASGSQGAGPRGVVVVAYPDDLGDRPLAVGATHQLHDQIDSGCHVLAGGRRRPAMRARECQGLQPPERTVGIVGVHRRERPGVTGVERLQQIERLGPPHLADDQPVGAQPQRHSHQLGHRDRPMTVGVGRLGLESHQVGMQQPELGRLFDGDDALVGREGRTERVEQGRLARTGAATDHDRLANSVPRREHGW